MANRRNVNGLSPVDLGFNSDANVSHINLIQNTIETNTNTIATKSVANSIK